MQLSTRSLGGDERATAGIACRDRPDATKNRPSPPAARSSSAFSVRQCYCTYMGLYVQRDGASWSRKLEHMIDPSADRAVFRQLADILRGQIDSGELGPGDPLPSELRLAQEFSISRTTVRQAIAQLRTEGLVSVERPRGTFVRVPEEIQLITLARGERVSARMPTDAERRSYRLAEGVPVFVVISTDGTKKVHPADRVQLTRP
jgi:DNA-binding transcriptional regulator YhcF (GntR family)